MREETREAIEQARQHLDGDPLFAACILRDLPEVNEKGLRDLAWLLANGQNYTTKNDVLYLIELLEAET